MSKALGFTATLGALVALTLVSGVGCGADDPVETGSDAGVQDGGSGATRDASRPAGGAGLDARVVLPIDDPSTRADTGGSIPTGPGDAGSTDASSARKICGGIAGLPCRDGEFCSQEDGVSGLGCGFPDSTGECVVRGRVCDAVLDPVCGCDQKTYGNDCEAHGAGVSIAKHGACAAGQNVDCDDRAGKVTCKKARPMCPEGQVPTVVDTCWGDCVAIDQCVCKEADACPERETYVCHMSAGHCGPYVN